MIQAKLLAVLFFVFSLTSFNFVHAAKPVGITSEVSRVKVTHNGEEAFIMRNQNNENIVDSDFAKTSRPCPPFCIQPSSIAPGVETIAELELMDYLGKIHNGDKTIMVVDSRKGYWLKKGTIPGAVNIPWTSLSAKLGDGEDSVKKIMMQKFNVKESGGRLKFDDAKTVVLFCNGIWCGQSPNNIRNLLSMGYPAEKIKWYRGGMQNWSNLGLTTVPGSES